MRVYPRLSETEARAMLREFQSLSVTDLGARASTTTEGCSFHPTYPNRASSSDLARLREGVLEVARAHGFPKERGRDYTAFDQELARLIVPLMDIAPGDAASRAVWNFVSLRVLPDVTAWRFPARTKEGIVTASDERWLGHPRNTYRRLWVRGYALGSDLAGALIEDNYVNIFERPTLGGDPRVARRLVSTMIAFTTVEPGRSLSLQEVMRDVAKRVLRVAGTVSLQALDDRQLQEVIDDAFGATAVQMTARDG